MRVGRHVGTSGKQHESHARVASMTTVTKKDLIDRIADKTGNKRVVVKRIIQYFLDDIMDELGRGNRLEFRDFGVFESKVRAARTAQNPKTLERVEVPEKRTVKFKVGRIMKIKLAAESAGKSS
jgi:integration host factor subunit beta